MTKSNHSLLELSTAALIGAAGGACLVWIWGIREKSPTTKRNNSPSSSDPETNYAIGHQLIWQNISGALNAAMIYTGDRLKLYTSIKQLCEKENTVTAASLAEYTGLSQRWLREWLAQQAGMGVLLLQPGNGDSDQELVYRFPWATSEVLANPESDQYDISLVQMVPCLVSRAKTMLPEAFRTGIGRPYDDPDIAEAIDRHHTLHVRSVFIPHVLPLSLEGETLRRLEAGCTVSDLGCGAGTLIFSLAKAFPKSVFHGFEISTVALEKAAINLRRERLTNVFFHDANETGESLGDYQGFFDVSLIYDVLHDCTQPQDLIGQVHRSLKKDGVFIFADIPSKPTVRENLQSPMGSTMYAVSTCLCMSCALSEEGGAGLGTLGFSIPLAKDMLHKGGFKYCDVLFENETTRWFEAEPM